MHIWRRWRGHLGFQGICAVVGITGAPWCSLDVTGECGSDEGHEAVDETAKHEPPNLRHQHLRTTVVIDAAEHPSPVPVPPWPSRLQTTKRPEYCGTKWNFQTEKFFVDVYRGTSWWWAAEFPKTTYKSELLEFPEQHRHPTEKRSSERPTFHVSV